MRVLSVIIVSSVLFFACSPATETQSKNNNPVEESENFNFKNSSPRFQSIALLMDGDFRGMNIGAPMSSVNDIEEMLIMNDDFYRHYQIDLNQYEFFDLLYYNFDGKLDEIAVDVHMESDDEAFQVFSDFENFFSAKYGKSLLDYDGHLVWNDKKKDGTTVAYNLKYVSTFPEDDTAVLEKKIEIGVKVVE